MFIAVGLYGLLVECPYREEYATWKNVGLITLLSVDHSLLSLQGWFLTIYIDQGLPSAALCMLGSGLANAAIFALVFPIVRFHSHCISTTPA